MRIKDLSFQQELNLDETKTSIQGGILDPFSFKPLTQVQRTFQTVGAGAGGGIGSNTINSPALAVGFQIPGQNGAIL